MTEGRALKERYLDLITSYIRTKNETSLYKGQQFGRELIEQRISPEEALNIHINVIQELFPDLSEDLRRSFDFLLEVMIDYGFAYREHQSLRNRQRQLDTEIEVAANVQESLLQGDIPNIDYLDIGVISKPAKKMNGDYHHFVHDDHDCLSVAIADVIGKGIPAALCMSMIKYAMDSLPEQRMQPAAVLENLNRVVEQNVDASMFITMLYGVYDPRVHHFYFSSAGHEPGFFYSAKGQTFEELTTQGLVLGVSRSTRYKEYEKALEIGDMIILLSDGVTECRTESGFIERDKIIELIRKNIKQPAQTIVDNVYAELERLQDFELRDDFTLIVMKRRV